MRIRSRLNPDHQAWLVDQAHRQLEFGRHFPHPQGGAGWLGTDGQVDQGRPVHTWITARMAHVYSLGALLGVPGAAELADVALAGLTDRLHDGEHGGWVAAVGPDGTVDDTKSAYTHAFVLLAGSTATMAGRPAGPALLAEATTALERFRTDQGLYAERWDRSFSQLDDYRGVNANMHVVEASLAAFDATGDTSHRDRAVLITENVLRWAESTDWRVPEHYDTAWRPLLEHHRDQPDHPFEPYGATPGHGLEWSRLVLSLRADLGEEAPEHLLPGAKALYDRAVTDGWAGDGTDGFVYTTDWDGRPVVRDRMHWVVCEAICAAAALHAATGEDRYDEDYAKFWTHATEHWLDPVTGSWHHQLTADLQPTDSVWPGRPDLYHSLHAALLPPAPLRTAARSLRDS